MFTRKILLLICVVPIVLQLSCSENSEPTKPKDMFSNYMSGTLSLEYFCPWPNFNETTQVDVRIEKDGTVTFGTGTLSYNADQNNGQTRIRRVGTLTLNPTGNCFNSNGTDYIGIDENTNLDETLTQWYWDPNTQTWVEVINQEIHQVWNGGLAFQIDDALLDQAVIQSSSAIWRLYLLIIP